MSIFSFDLPTTGILTPENRAVIKLRWLVVYLGSLAAFFVPPTPGLLVLTAVSFYLRAFGWEGGHHRYFAHRSFKTSRAFQFVLACLGASSGQRGPLWWACSHRAHHRYSDTSQDLHSPIGNGLLYAYVGWVFDGNHCDTNLDETRDWVGFPELVWINKYHYLVPYLYLAAIYALGEWTPLFGGGAGIAAVVWGFLVSTLLSLQGSFLVNTLAHAPKPGWFAYRSYRTPDKSVNHWLLCVLSLGASWHNNHHRYMNSARAGFRWWELDITYLTLRLLAAAGLVWDLREVPEHILMEARVAPDAFPPVGGGDPP
jgi:stearoyl-CoA desaturase (Delta-9 desaturase)